MNNLRGKVVGKELVDEHCLRPSEVQQFGKEAFVS